jgi:hypothetical protein
MLSALKILLPIIYVLSFIPRWYEDKWSVRNIVERPSLINTADKQFRFLIINFVLRWGACIGWWFVFDHWDAVIMLISHFIVAWLISRPSFNREADRWIEFYKSEARINYPGIIDEKKLSKEAYAFARKIMYQNSKGKPFADNSEKKNPLGQVEW